MKPSQKRMLKLLEPVTQQHRLIVARKVIEQDEQSLLRIEGADTRKAYSLMYQYAHLTRDKDSLKHDDRLESLAGALRRYAAVLGVDPEVAAQRATEERLDEELERLFATADSLAGVSWGTNGRVTVGNFAPNMGKRDSVRALSPSKR